VPVPERDAIDTPPVVAAVEKSLSVRLLDAAILPPPDNTNVPEDMVVAPV